MSNLYNKELNDYCRKYIFINNQLTKNDILLQPIIYKQLQAKIFEDLLLFDKITFKVYGENAPLAILINELSIRGLEELIEQDSLRFALWTPMVAYMKTNIKGVFPLVSGRLNSNVHTDPEYSIETGLKLLSNKLNIKQQRIIKRKTRDLYIIPKEDIEKDTTQFSISAYNSNKFKQFGLDKESSDLYALNEKEKKLLNKCAEDLLEYKFLISEQLTSNNNSIFNSLFNNTLEKLQYSKHNDIVSIISNLETFPNLVEVYFNSNSSLKDIHKLRNKKNIKKFRSWLDEVSTDYELQEVSKAYINAIVNSKGFFETKKGRLTKNITMSLLGAGIGSIAGPLGATIGGFGGKVLEPALDFSLDLVDEYLISELTKGWTPRMFFDDLKK